MCIKEVIKDIGKVINLLAVLKENTMKIMKTRVVLLILNEKFLFTIFLQFAILPLFALPPLILMMIQVQALAD